MGKRSHYHKLKKILTTTQLILEDIVEPEDDEFGMEKSPPKSKRKGGEADYEDKRSALINFSKSSLNAKESNDLFIQRGYRLLDSAKRAGEDAQFKVKEVVVDLTKLSNELKEIQNTDEEKLTIDRIRKVLRYVTTAMNNANQTIKELNEKRMRMEEEINWDEYEREIEALNKKYGIDQWEEFGEEIAEKQAEARNNAQEIERENKEIIRAFRALLGQLYSVPEEIAQTSKVYLKAYGAVASLSNKGTQYNMKKEGILKILKDPKLYEELKDFIEINEDVADRVQIVNSRLPDIGTYFAELNLQVEEKIEQMEELQDEIDKKSKQKNEAFIPKIMEKTKGVFVRAIMKFIGILAEETHQLYTKIKKTIKPIVKSLGVIDKKLDTNRNNARKHYLRIKRELKELDVEVIAQAEKKL